MNKWQRTGWLLCATAGASLAGLWGTNRYYKSESGAGCARCHEMTGNVAKWKISTHRKTPCLSCHDDDWRTNLRHVAVHLSGGTPERVILRTIDVQRMLPRCGQCHAQEFAQWRAGPHSAPYERIFLDREHNRKRHLMDDCFRCHGMHFEGSIRQLVQPIDATGPWRLAATEMQGMATMPCLACHAVHAAGSPLAKPATRVGREQEPMRPSLGLFDRRSRMHIPVARLTKAAVTRSGKLLRSSGDARGYLCVQCHAPLASGDQGSGDDRTPAGVHEGLSCLSCHQKHSQNTRASCATCHPRLSNCGVDVERMDTTFVSPKSRFDIHTVACVDCHAKGIPMRGRKER